LTVFLLLCVGGFIVGFQARPDPTAVPYVELFDEMSVVSYRDSPADTTARFVVDLGAGGQVFRRYEIDEATFSSPPRERDYNRGITRSVYRPLQVRGHIAQGLWLDVPRMARRSFLPEQFDELYRATLDFVKPVSLVAGTVGMLSGYSVGYRLGVWNHSLRSRAVQDRVLATPGLGRVIAREAWRRVLLEPLVMGAEDDAKRFAATSATQRIYTNFFRVALNDSDGFIPREAARLASLGRAYESRTMTAFAEAVHRAKLDAPVTSQDFDAVERWASLLVRRGHWAAGAIPPAGEERARYLGTLAWYGVAPPTPETSRIWIGPRLLVREGEVEGFISDDVLASGFGCPIGWRGELEKTTGANVWAMAWSADHPEFRALASLAGRVAGHIVAHTRQLASQHPDDDDSSPGSDHTPDAVAATSASRIQVIPTGSDSAATGRGSPGDSLPVPALTPPPADTLRAPSFVPMPRETTSADSSNG
jgi:hypothetical protein